VATFLTVDIGEYWSDFRCRQGVHLFWRTRSRWTPEFRTTKFVAENLQRSLYRTI